MAIYKLCTVVKVTHYVHVAYRTVRECAMIQPTGGS